MGRYRFSIYCVPDNNLRVTGICNWLSLMKDAFNLEAVYDGKDRQVPLDMEYLLKLLEKDRHRQFPKLGVDIDLFSIKSKLRDDNTILFEIHSGSSEEIEFCNDFYKVDYGDVHPTPDYSYFEKAISIFNAYEAYLEEFDNEYDIGELEIEQKHPNKPTMIRGFHYISKVIIDSMGGINKCMNAPAWKVYQYGNGIIIRLIEGLFDNENAEHRKAQIEIMKYFGML